MPILVDSFKLGVSFSPPLYYLAYFNLLVDANDYDASVYQVKLWSDNLKIWFELMDNILVSPDRFSPRYTIRDIGNTMNGQRGVDDNKTVGCLLKWIVWKSSARVVRYKLVRRSCWIGTIGKTHRYERLSISLAAKWLNTLDITSGLMMFSCVSGRGHHLASKTQKELRWQCWNFAK